MRTDLSRLGVSERDSAWIASCVFDRERLPVDSPNPVISEVEAFETVQSWIAGHASALDDGEPVDALLIGIFGTADRGWMPKGVIAAMAEVPAGEDQYDIWSDSPDLEDLVRRIVSIANRHYGISIESLPEDADLPKGGRHRFDDDLAVAMGLPSVSTAGRSTIGEVFEAMVRLVPPVPTSPYAGDRIDFLFAGIGLPPDTPFRRSVSGHHEFNASCLGGVILPHLDDPNLARARVAILVNLLSQGRCPRCGSHLEQSPLGSNATACRCIPLCSQCSEVERASGTAIASWPFADTASDEDELVLSTINLLVTPKPDVTPPNHASWRTWSYPSWPNRILGRMPPDGIKRMTMVGRLERRDEHSEIERRILGCFLGGAVGDALGERAEFMSFDEIRQLMGPDGVQGYWQRSPHSGAFTDDTQMTLWTAEGLIRTMQRAAGSDYNWWSPLNVTNGSYQRWLLTQGLAADSDHPTLQPEYLRTGWLITVPGLWSKMAPGRTCLSALRGGRPGTVDDPINDSKGCGGVMRVAPAGLVPYDGFAFDLGCELAAITHGHPSGYFAAGALAHIIHLLTKGHNLEDAVNTAITRLESEPNAQPCVDALLDAMKLAAGERPSHHIVERQGGGWVAEEALGIAVYCALVADDFRSGVLLAVNHGGDSDSTGSITGQLLGTILGVDAIPREWLERLRLGTVIERIARDFVASFYDDHVFPAGLYPPW